MDPAVQTLLDVLDCIYEELDGVPVSISAEAGILRIGLLKFDGLLAESIVERSPAVRECLTHGRTKALLM